MIENKLIVSSSPHIHQNETVSSIMLDVIIALLPAAIMGTYVFGFRAAVVILTSVAACVASEYLYEKLTKRRVTVRDLSAVVTGLLLGLNMPSTIPLWMVAIGSVFAIVIVKQLYGGLGKNFMNPALAARCFMLIAWAGAMTSFPAAFSADAVSSATPLAIMKGSSEGVLPSFSDMFIGRTGGSIGETSSIALIIGFLYLFFRRVISWKIPVVYVLSFGLLTYFFGQNNTELTTFGYTLYQVCGGGLLLGAIFMATDYTTTPTTPNGAYVFALGCGILSFAIRRFGGYPEGVSFSILLMNLATPLIDKLTMPRKFGAISKRKG